MRILKGDKFFVSLLVNYISFFTAKSMHMDTGPHGLF